MNNLCDFCKLIKARYIQITGVNRGMDICGKCLTAKRKENAAFRLAGKKVRM